MSTLHITNGSAAGDKLQTFVDGPVVLMCDVLHEGPAPEVDDEAWYEIRARFLSAYDRSNPEEIRAGLAASDRAVADAAVRDDEIVLWFEHDFFDQLALIRTLDLIARLAPPARRANGSASVSLIGVDRFPGDERFIGLGQLEPAQLATLFPARLPVTSDHLALASAAWAAFRSPDPQALADVAARATTDRAARAALPFLGDALLRFLAEYPSIENGLTHTETLVLTTLMIAGPMRAGSLFEATQAREERPFLGDWTFYDIVCALAGTPVPLVTIEGASKPTDLRDRPVAISAAGREVLACRMDRVALNGIDVWRGGVHLNGAGRPWRWDASRKRLVS